MIRVVATAIMLLLALIAFWDDALGSGYIICAAFVLIAAVTGSNGLQSERRFDPPKTSRMSRLSDCHRGLLAACGAESRLAAPPMLSAWGLPTTSP